jgi:hypothetical protein
MQFWVAPLGGSGACKRLRPERGAGGKRRGAAPPSESERGWGPASSEKCRQNLEVAPYHLYPELSEMMIHVPVDEHAPLFR